MIVDLSSNNGSFANGSFAQVDAPQVVIHEEGQAILKVESGTTLEVLKLLYESQYDDQRKILGVRPSKDVSDIPCIITLNESKLEHGDYDVIIRDPRITPPMSPNTTKSVGDSLTDEEKTTVRCMECSRESWKTKRYTTIGMNTEISITPSIEMDSLRSKITRPFSPPKSEISYAPRNTRGRPPVPLLHPHAGNIVYAGGVQKDYLVSTIPIGHPTSNYESEFLERKCHRACSPKDRNYGNGQTKICYPYKNSAIDLDLVPYENIRSIHRNGIHRKANSHSPPMCVKLENDHLSPPHMEKSRPISPPIHRPISPPIHRLKSVKDEEFISPRSLDKRHYYHPYNMPVHHGNYYESNRLSTSTQHTESTNENGPPVYVLPNDFDHTNDRLDNVMSYSDQKPYLPMEANNNNMKTENGDIPSNERQSPISANGSESGKSVSDDIKPVLESEKRFPCKICKESFPTKSTLYKHLRGHPSEEKPFKCNECGQGFTLSSNLRQHRIIHRGYKPFQCEYCGKKFMRSNVYKQHRRIHTGEQMHKCTYCPSEFLQKYALIKHLKKAHNIEHFDS